MKRGIWLIALVTTLVLVGGTSTDARELGARRTADPLGVNPPVALPAPVDPLDDEALVPSMSGLAESMTPEQAQALTTPPGEWAHEALGRVIHFLELDPGQVEALVDLLQQRHQAVVPLVHAIVVREQELRDLFQAGDPDPADVGQLVLEIRHLYKSIALVQAQFVMAFEGLLDMEQQHKLGALRLAAQLQPLLPAFRALGVL